MKKQKILLISLLILFANFANAQKFELGEKTINIGLGLGTTLYSGVGYNMTLPPISASFEYGMKELGPGILGIGGYIGMAGYKWEASYLGDIYGWKYSNIIIGARGNYHYNFMDKLDTYGGLMLGFDIVSAKETGTFPFGLDASANASSFIYAFYVGGRYYFSDKFAAMAELGYGIAWLTIGVSFKL